MSQKSASTDYPIHQFLAERWSPYAFQDRPVSDADLRSLFEAARWAASSYNEQPWSYIVATRDNPDHFQQILSCLVEPNQAWAKNAPVLALGVTTLKFTRTNEDNKAAIHDLGAASCNIAVEATARGICIHQMIGILPDKARDLFAIPEHSQAWTAMAIGYQGDPMTLPTNVQQRDLTPRQRKPLAQFVFGGKWGEPSPVVKQGS
jgi:nitroreductase